MQYAVTHKANHKNLKTVCCKSLEVDTNKVDSQIENWDKVTVEILNEKKYFIKRSRLVAMTTNNSKYRCGQFHLFKKIYNLKQKKFKTTRVLWNTFFTASAADHQVVRSFFQVFYFGHDNLCQSVKLEQFVSSSLALESKSIWLITKSLDYNS